MLALLLWVLHEVPAEVRERFFASAGPAFRPLWWFTRRGFERRDRAALLYA